MMKCTYPLGINCPDMNSFHSLIMVILIIVRAIIVILIMKIIVVTVIVMKIISLCVILNVNAAKYQTRSRIIFMNNS